MHIYNTNYYKFIIIRDIIESAGVLFTKAFIIIYDTVEQNTVSFTFMSVELQE